MLLTDLITLLGLVLVHVLLGTLKDDLALGGLLLMKVRYILKISTQLTFLLTAACLMRAAVKALLRARRFKTDSGSPAGLAAGLARIA